jgi:hypothetical protein
MEAGFQFAFQMDSASAVDRRLACRMRAVGAKGRPILQRIVGRVRERRPSR